MVNYGGGAASITVTPSGDTTGATDANRITAAVGKLPSTGGLIALEPSATWYILCGQVSINQSNVTLNAPGCYIKAVGAGDMIRMYDSTTPSGRLVQGGGITGFPILDGTATTGNSTAVHLGDVFRAKLEVSVQNWTAGTTSKGVWLDNQWFWTEQLRADIYGQSCTTCVMFDNSTGTSVSASATGSFDRFTGELFIDSNGVGDGVTFNNGAMLDNYRLGIWGNFSTSTTQYSVLKITGSNAGGSSKLISGWLWAGVELDDAVHTAPYTINFGAAGNTITQTRGFLDFAASANTFTSSNTSGANLFFDGPIYGDSSLFPAENLLLKPTAITVTTNGQNLNTTEPNGSFCRANPGASSFTGLILTAGTITAQRITVVNQGTGSLTFAAAGTSNVADGASDVIAAKTAAHYFWDGGTSLWYRCV